MTQNDSCCRFLSRVIYSCHWEQSSDNNSKRACCWFLFVALVSLLSLCWMYIWYIASNDQDEVNWNAFTKLNLWVNWFVVVMIISALLTSYCVLLLLFALIQLALQEPLDLHWLHKILLFLDVLVIVSGVTVITKFGRKEWSTVLLSMQAAGPFLQFGAVGALTVLSPFVLRGFHMADKKWSKLLIAVVFLTVSAVIFLCPLYIQSPCLIEKHNLPEKPKLIGHRGAPMLAPENTMMSFNKSIACGVTAFETDVQLSKDRIPFLMHDKNSGFLLRTTDVKEKFPNQNFNSSTSLTWDEYQTLNAGEWFLKADPFRSVSKLSEEDVETARNQTIPSLHQLLILAKQHNISVLFDLYNPDEENDTEDIVNTILNSGINPRLVLWLPPKKREFVKKTVPGFIQVYSNSENLQENKGNYLNAPYNLSMEKIRELRGMNVTVNLWVVNEPWLFSLLWCAGVSSVTTNSCHILKKMDKPHWVMALQTYNIAWISVNIVAIVLMTGLYMFHWKRHCFRHRTGIQNQRDNTSVLHDREQVSLLL
uniref:glycerophosphoinositol inositolphosphodiesterase GDPD2 n=1 Tax=Scatophagus argus TaxID=75038 RepID=UPI001ED7F266|nr:glycerophosphoinositol inositolphosphodiesterase GDPD2 [Scatophagus argus]XP_046261551.1 glycerophosphoinositol inositolphosphodiesterase GDPD2 [Scatophagus argus]